MWVIGSIGSSTLGDLIKYLLHDKIIIEGDLLLLLIILLLLLLFYKIKKVDL